jgi:hypothetical protein
VIRGERFVALVQQSLFADEDAAPRPKRSKPNPDLSRNKLLFMLNCMRSATKWPYSAESVSFFRATLWPQAYSALDPEEAARMRTEIESEAARLDAAA